MEAGAMNADDGQWTQLVRALKEPSGTMFAACPDMVSTVSIGPVFVSFNSVI
ncbi:MAG: hypothetical protein MHM6MM_007021 [Cercozoa sp. M6MM]